MSSLLAGVRDFGDVHWRPGASSFGDGKWPR
jgi:hypothetical protein